MTEMQSGDLSLIAYDSYEYSLVRLCETLHALVGDAFGTIRADFPCVIERYSTLESARASVMSARRAMTNSNGKFGAYLVEHCGVPIGVVTYSHYKLCESGLHGFFRRKLVEGPLIAGWLVPVHCREGQTKNLLPQLMQLGAQIMRSTPGASGDVWTIVRPEHTYVKKVLGGNKDQNGFGRFEPLGAPSDYSAVDNVTDLRQVWVCKSATWQN